MAADEGISLEDFLGAVERIVHGTTVTTNAVLTGNTVPTGLLSTRGFRDALEMRRGIREVLYDNKYKPPAPIVPRWLRRPVTGRIDQAGTEVEPFAVHDIDAAAAIFDAAGIRAVAICFMHAYANGAHEHAAAARLRGTDARCLCLGVIADPAAGAVL